MNNRNGLKSGTPAIAGLFKSLLWQGKPSVEAGLQGLSLLLSLGVTLDGALCHGDLPPLFHAIHDVHLLRRLISLGANVNQCVDEGFSPLFLATHSGATEAARILVEAGADPQVLAFAVQNMGQGQKYMRALEAVKGKHVPGKKGTDTSDSKTGDNDDNDELDAIAALKTQSKETIETRIRKATSDTKFSDNGVAQRIEPHLPYLVIIAAQNTRALTTIFHLLLPVIDSSWPQLRSALLRAVMHVLQHKKDASSSSSGMGGVRPPGSGHVLGKSDVDAFVTQFSQSGRASNPLYSFFLCTFPSLIQAVTDAKNIDASSLLTTPLRTLLSSNTSSSSSTTSATATIETKKPPSSSNRSTEIERAIERSSWTWTTSIAINGAKLPDKPAALRVLRALANGGHHVDLVKALAVVGKDAVSNGDSKDHQRFEDAGQIVEAIFHLCNAPDAMLQVMLSLLSSIIELIQLMP
jgi:hypothetical protein